ncbi:hypothetical protein DPMN_136287 [Dreissena polymorpha]|uniref:Uncharacterized protein n=1 Tax=Dreissena polymorpha TaxID=45954 RepID=A0A9D4FZF6_DREPO|nr:hypothetical protein DPMN_136287 [Dreissena polymorpha]
MASYLLYPRCKSEDDLLLKSTYLTEESGDSRCITIAVIAKATVQQSMQQSVQHSVQQNVQQSVQQSVQSDIASLVLVCEDGLIRNRW